jgi:DNA-binding response OmpR family regulator
MVDALSATGDDYIAKPYRIAELVARVNAVMRRRSRQSDGNETLESLGIWFQDGSVSFRERRIDLTRLEYELFSCLSERMGLSVSREKLVTALYWSDSQSYEGALKTAVWRLRKKLEGVPISIEAANSGYRMVVAREVRK